MTVQARYPFTCCQWSTMSADDRDALIQLVNAAGDQASSLPNRGGEQRAAIERIRQRANVRVRSPKSRTHR